MSPPRDMGRSYHWCTTLWGDAEMTSLLLTEGSCSLGCMRYQNVALTELHVGQRAVPSAVWVSKNLVWPIGYGYVWNPHCNPYSSGASPESHVRGGRGEGWMGEWDHHGPADGLVFTIIIMNTLPTPTITSLRNSSFTITTDIELVTY